MIFERLSLVATHNEKLVSQNFTFLSCVTSLNQGLCISFQLKSHMWCHETGRTARVSDMQYVNMSPQRVTRHFTLFVAVLSLFLHRFGADLGRFGADLG